MKNPSVKHRDQVARRLEQMLSSLRERSFRLTPQRMAVLEILAVSYTHLRAHETVLDLVCRLLLEKKNKTHHILLPAFTQHQSNTSPPRTTLLTVTINTTTLSVIL